jgi:hypothetical protein
MNPDLPERALHLAKVAGAALVIAKLDRLSRNGGEQNAEQDEPRATRMIGKTTSAFRATGPFWSEPRVSRIDQGPAPVRRNAPSAIPVGTLPPPGCWEWAGSDTRPACGTSARTHRCR